MKLRSIFSILMCLVLVAALALPALAQEGAGSGDGSGSSQVGGQGGDNEGGGGSQGGSGGNEGGSNPGGSGGNEGGGSNPGGSGGNEGGGSNPGGSDGNEGGGSNPGGSGGNEGGSNPGGSGGNEGGGNQGGSGGSEGGDGTSAPSTPTTPTTHEHKWGTGKVTKEATCTEAGTKEYSCACGEKKTEAIAAKGHKYDNACDSDCNHCGAVRKTEHKPGQGWLRDFSGHWHICSVCKNKVDIGKHYPGPAATEDKDQICMTCGYLLTRKTGHVHKYQTTFTSDESGHWYACEGCGEKKDFTEHTYDNPCDPDCNVCGYKRDSAHYYGDTLEHDEQAHWGICTLCGEVGKRDAHIPGDEATEHTPQTCVVCGLELAPALDHVHESEVWESDEEKHWKECACGEILEEGPHGWDMGTENPDSTVTYVCAQCGAEKTEGEPKAEKDSQFPWMLVVVIVSLGCAAGAVGILVYLLAKKPAGKFTK